MQRTIEVTPNVYYTLRGAEETSVSIRNGTCAHVACLSCHSVLACVKDCVMVICPVCRVLSPVENNEVTVPAAAAAKCPPDEGAAAAAAGRNKTTRMIDVPPFVGSDPPPPQKNAATPTEKEEEEDAAAARRRRRRQPPRHGVGLGLKIAERSPPVSWSSCH